MLKLVEDYSGSKFAVYAHDTGRGVIMVEKRQGPNAAIFESVAQAQEKALALMWGGSVKLTHRLRKPATEKAGE